MDLISFRKHIIHASYMDMFFGVENTPLYPRNIPDVSTFQINARGSAVNSSDHVVIYENTGRFGYFMGARAWWMFKVCMLINLYIGLISADYNIITFIIV